MNKRAMVGLVLAGVCVGLAGGCSVNEADKTRAAAASPIANPNFQRYEFNLPPKRLVEVAQRVVSSEPFSVPVESVSKGAITTGWKEYPGAMHVVRRWQERTRFQIVVSPDFDEPTTKSSVRVSQETQTRATSQADWFALLDYDRSDRAVELAKAIEAAAKAEAAK